MRGLTISLVIFSALHSFAEGVIFPAEKGGERLVIASNTDAYAITPLIRGFQEVYPQVEIEYKEFQSLALFNEAYEACKSGAFFADIVLSSAMGFQFQLANDGCATELADMSFMPDWTIWSDELIGLTFEPAAMVFAKTAFPNGAPQTHLELIDYTRANPEHISQIGTYDVETSGVGKLFAFADAQSSASAAQLQLRLIDGNVQTFGSTSQIIDLVVDGHLDIGYNVLGSYALFRAELDPRLGVTFLGDFTPVLTRAAYISRETRSGNRADQFIKFAVSSDGEQLLAERSFLMSSRRGATQLSEYLDLSLPFLRPIALEPSLMLAQ